MADVFGLLNLIARSRRQKLPAAERRQLEHAVEASAALRSIQQASRDFAVLAEVRPGDDELIDRSVTRALACREQRRGSGTRRLPSAFMLAAAAMLVGASTAFGYWGMPRAITVVSPVAMDVPKRSVSLPGHSRMGTPRSEPSEIEAEPLLLVPTAVGTSSAPTARFPATTQPSAQMPLPLGAQTPGSSSATVPSRAALDAAALFSNANAARRARHAAQAIQTFRQLQSQFPQSSEAAVSHLSLGNLLLEGGDAASALLEFIQVRGALAEEGLIGQARAYDKLGRHEDTQLIWKQLREQFPNSIYARPVQGPSMGTSAAQSPK